MRRLLRSGRRAAGGLTQRAAAELAGISAVRWQQIESGTAAQAPADTLAAMFLATGATAQRLRDAGYPDVADAMDELSKAKPAPVGPEEHLAATPGASAEEISALQAVWRAIKAPRTAGPVGGELGDTPRRLNSGK